MDQKRILWIVAASGVFLLVVVGVALFLSAPQVQAQQTLASLQGTGNTWIKGEVKNTIFEINNRLAYNNDNNYRVNKEEIRNLLFEFKLNLTNLIKEKE